MLLGEAEGLGELDLSEATLASQGSDLLAESGVEVLLGIGHGLDRCRGSHRSLPWVSVGGVDITPPRSILQIELFLLQGG